MSCALFKHECHMHVHIVYTWMSYVYSCCLHTKLCTWLSCLNNAWDLCLNYTNLWNNKFKMEWTHEFYMSQP
jgi:hypothetical protein